MLFSLTAQYTPKALNGILDDPSANRAAAVGHLLEAAGGKLVAMYSTAAEGPGVLVIMDVPDPNAAPAIAGIAIAAGTIHNVKLTRLITQEEVANIRQRARELRSAYKPPMK